MIGGRLISAKKKRVPLEIVKDISNIRECSDALNIKTSSIN